MNAAFSILRKIFSFLLLSIAFGIACKFERIYYSHYNQNTKYLQALAETGYGFLDRDWLANTIDPLPFFSQIVKITHNIHPEYLFYIYYILLLGVYIFSLLAIADSTFKIRDKIRRNKFQFQFAFYFLLLLVFHATDIEIEVLNIQTRKILTEAFADQYLIGAVFEPATFGVFVLFSLYIFLQKKPFLAISLLGLAATFHPAYLPTAAIFTLIYMGIVGYEEKGLVKPVLLGFLSLALVVPVCWYMLSVFDPTTPELYAKAQEIIVRDRIPHHSLPQIWLQESSTYFQLGFVVIATFLTRGTRLFAVLAGATGAIVLLTIAQILTDSNTLAFMAPWRLSVFLVPLSSAIVAARISMAFGNLPWLKRARSQRFGTYAIAAIIAIVLIYNAFEQVAIFRTTDKTQPAMDFVRASKQAGDVYAIDPDARKLRKFRLYTGAPIFVNHKSHPYKDVETIAWAERLEIARSFYREATDRCAMADTLASLYRVTHVVWRGEKRLDKDCDRFLLLHQDKRYAVYKIQATSKQNPSKNK